MKAHILRFLYRKMWNTRWLTLSSLFGLIVAVSFTVSIPMYTDGSLKRVVTKTLEAKSTGMPAGSVLLRYQAAGGIKTKIEDLDKVNAYIREEIPKQVSFPVLAYKEFKGIRPADVTPVDSTKVDASRVRNFSLTAMSNLKDKVRVTSGSWFSSAPKKDVIEVLMLEEAMYRNDVRVGDELYYPVYTDKEIELKVKIVGVFEPKNQSDTYWHEDQENVMNYLLVDETQFKNHLLKEMNIPLHGSTWYYNFDLRDIKTSQLSNLKSVLTRIDIDVYQKLKDTKVDISFSSLLDEFRKQGLQLQTLLFTLAAPMIAMVMYYITMNAKQALEKQRSDIAVLRSRGSSTRQIFFVYLIEGALLGAIALAIAPLIGWFMGKSIGSANGFLSFVNRKSIPVAFTQEAMWYGIAAVCIALFASVIPAVVYAKSSIVNYKQKQARTDRAPFWQRWYLDFALLGIVGFGYYLLQDRQFLSQQTGMSTDQLQVQPFLFFVPALAIFSLGLLFLRVFPWILRFFTWIARSVLPLPLYLTVTQLSRSSIAYYPLMILLILTLGLGVYNSSAARTIDQNTSDRTHYKYGADLQIETNWENTPEFEKPKGGKDGKDGGKGGGVDASLSKKPQELKVVKNHYTEPPFEFFKNLKGVQAATRVLEKKVSATVSGKSVGQGNLLGIDNVDFAKVAWFRNDLLPAHQNKYLNLLSYYENAVLIPTNIAKTYQLKPGDTINILIDDQNLEMIIVGIVPYWPTQYPAQTPFYIANLDYIYDQASVMPYKVWLKLSPDAKIKPMFEEIQKKGIEVFEWKDVKKELLTLAKEPSRGGVFGILSLGFLVSVLISLVGYLLYWFFNLSGRIVQFGVLRAMGLSKKQLSTMLLLEQGFTAGLSILLGIGIGKLTSLLFLGFLQTTDNVKLQAPPFRVIFEAKDQYRLYIAVLLMIITGALLMRMYIKRLRVHEAVKMGEER